MKICILRNENLYFAKEVGVEGPSGPVYPTYLGKLNFRRLHFVGKDHLQTNIFMEQKVDNNLSSQKLNMKTGLKLSNKNRDRTKRFYPFSRNSNRHYHT